MPMIIKGGKRYCSSSNLAKDIIYDNETSDMDATNVQNAINELNTNLNVRYNEIEGYIQLYYNGQWNNWIKSNVTENELYGTYLYYQGTDYKSITGGWSGYPLYPKDSEIDYPKAPTVTMYNSHMECKGEATGQYAGTVFSGYAIKLNDYDYIEINYTATELGSASAQKAATFKTVETREDKYTNGATVKLLSTTNTTATLDIRDITGYHYLGLFLAHMQVDIYSIKLIPKMD